MEIITQFSLFVMKNYLIIKNKNKIDISLQKLDYLSNDL